MKLTFTTAVALGLSLSTSLASTALAQDGITGDPDAGKREWRSCRSCHQTAEGRNGAGPSLYGVIGATAGQVAGFRYSDAMTGAGIIWDAASLDAFIADPEGYLDGTKMSYRGLADATKRANLIAYIAQETAIE